MLKRFASDTLEEVEDMLDDFVGDLDPDQLNSISPMVRSESGEYSLYCDYKRKDN